MDSYTVIQADREAADKALQSLLLAIEPGMISPDEAVEEIAQTIACHRHQSIAPYVEALREAREAIAPFAYAAFEANGYPDEEAFTLTLRPDDEDGLREEGDEPESLLTARQLRATRAALAKIDALLSQQEASNG